MGVLAGVLAQALPGSEEKELASIGASIAASTPLFAKQVPSKCQHPRQHLLGISRGVLFAQQCAYYRERGNRALVIVL